MSLLKKLACDHGKQSKTDSGTANKKCLHSIFNERMLKLGNPISQIVIGWVVWVRYDYVTSSHE